MCLLNRIMLKSTVAIIGITVPVSSFASGEFSEAAIRKMTEMKDQYGTFVGSQYNGPENKDGLTIIDCFRFTRAVLMDAFENVGESHHANRIAQLYEDGGDVAKYLVENAGWISYFWAPDVRIPADGDSKHPYSAQQANKKRRHYYLHPQLYPSRFVPIDNYVVNFRPTPLAVYEDTALVDVSGIVETIENPAGIAHINSLDFCYGITNGAVHTFLFSKGDVFEVHWDYHGPTSSDPDDRALEGENQLFEVSSFYENFSNYEKNGWLSGVLVCPPDDVSVPPSLATYDSGRG